MAISKKTRVLSVIAGALTATYAIFTLTQWFATLREVVRIFDLLWRQPLSAVAYIISWLTSLFTGLLFIGVAIVLFCHAVKPLALFFGLRLGITLLSVSGTLLNLIQLLTYGSFRSLMAGHFPLQWVELTLSLVVAVLFFVTCLLAAGRRTGTGKLAITTIILTSVEWVLVLVLNLVQTAAAVTVLNLFTGGLYLVCAILILLFCKSYAGDKRTPPVAPPPAI